MRNFFLVIFPLFVLACQKDIYVAFDKKSAYSFNIGDILVYKGNTTIDSFFISSIDKSVRNSDKVLTVELLEIVLTDLTADTDQYCLDMRIKRDAQQGTHLYFRNGYSSTEKKSPSDYNIGNHLIQGVYEMDFKLGSHCIKEDVKTIYYTEKYGIIAYELVNGEVLELEGRYFSE